MFHNICVLSKFMMSRQKVITELTEKCKSQEGKMEQVKGFEAERRKYEVLMCSSVYVLNNILNFIIAFLVEDYFLHFFFFFLGKD